MIPQVRFSALSVLAASVILIHGLLKGPSGLGLYGILWGPQKGTPNFGKSPYDTIRGLLRVAHGHRLR